MEFRFVSAQIPDFGILRIAALPGNLSEEIVSKSVKRRTTRILELLAKAEKLRDDLIVTLEMLVPHMTSTNDRHDILTIKRRIKSYKTVSNEIVNRVFANINKYEIGTKVSDWNADWTQLEELILRHNSSPQYESFFEKVCENELFVNAISMSSPSLTKKLKNRHSLSAKRNRAFNRSIFSYLTRAAFKTSPFSSFTLNALLRFDTGIKENVGHIKDLQLISSYKLNRTIATVLGKAVACRYPELFGGVKLSNEIGKSHHPFVFRYELRRFSLWKEQELLSPDPILRRLADLIDIDNSIDKDFTRALRRNLLVPNRWWGGRDNDPDLILHKFLSSGSKLHRCENTDFTIQFLNSARKKVNGLQETKYLQKSATLAEIKGDFEEVCRLWRRGSPPKLRSVVFEDCWTKTNSLQISHERMIEVTSKVGRVISKKLKPNPEYLWLVSFFIENFGEDGECNNVREFLKSAWFQLVGNRSQILQRNYTSNFNIDYSGELIPLTLFLQFEAESSDEIGLSDTKIVVNLAYERTSWQSYRHTGSGPNSSKITQLTSEWLQKISGEKHPTSINISGDCNNLQAGGIVTPYNLDLEDQDQESLTAEDLIIRLNKSSGMLELFDQTGRQLRTFYLGSTVPMAAWGPRYLYILLNEPFKLGRPALPVKPNRESDLNSSKRDSHTRNVIRIPRLEVDNVVLIREAWWIKSSYIEEFCEKNRAYGNIISLCKLAELHSMPFENYSKGYSDPALVSFSPSYSDKRKPQWTDLRSKRCVDHLIKLAREVEWIVFTEPLPRPNKQWVYVNGRPHVSELLVDIAIQGKFE